MNNFYVGKDEKKTLYSNEGFSDQARGEEEKPGNRTEASDCILILINHYTHHSAIKRF